MRISGFVDVIVAACAELAMDLAANALEGGFGASGFGLAGLGAIFFGRDRPPLFLTRPAFLCSKKLVRTVVRS